MPVRKSVTSMKGNKVGKRKAKPKSLGTVEIAGESVEIRGLFRVFKEEREVLVVELADGSIAIETKSWLRRNDRKLVTTRAVFTRETFAMLAETIVLGSAYLEIDLKAIGLQLHGGSDGEVQSDKEIRRITLIGKGRERRICIAESRWEYVD